jgi:hypothetical protein
VDEDRGSDAAETDGAADRSRAGGALGLRRWIGIAVAALLAVLGLALLGGSLTSVANARVAAVSTDLRQVAVTLPDGSLALTAWPQGPPPALAEPVVVTVGPLSRVVVGNDAQRTRLVGAIVLVAALAVLVWVLGRGRRAGQEAADPLP